MTFLGYLNTNSKITQDCEFIPTVQIRTLRLREFKGRSRGWATGRPMGSWLLGLALIGFVKIIHTSDLGEK